MRPAAFAAARRGAAPVVAEPAETSDLAPVPDLPQPTSDRRKGNRRMARKTRAFTPPEPQHRMHGWLPRRWPALALIMLIALCGGQILATSVPDLHALLLIGSAMLGVLPRRAARQMASRRHGRAKLAVCVVFVALPPFLFALGMAHWTIHGGLPGDAMMAAVAGTSLVAGAYLRRRPALMFAVHLATWTAVTISFSSIAGWGTLALVLLVSARVSQEQWDEQLRDRQEMEANERAQTRARDILADYEETGQGWFWEIDRRAQLTYVSPPVAEVLGLEVGALIGQPLTRLFDMDQSGEESERSLQFHLSARSSFSELDMRAATDEEVRWWSVSGRPIYDQFNNYVGFRGSGTDLTERRRSQEHASRLAHYDSLTGLANRFQMSQSLEKILSSPQLHHRDCAVMLLDLDRFKHVNDTLGHPAGDALLMQVAQRLERAVGSHGQVGRLGGDEFEVIIPRSMARDHLGTLAAEIIYSLSQPYSIEGQRVVIGASIGMAVSPADGSTSEALIRNADLALYAAKDGGRGRYHFYADDLHAEAEERSQLEEDLRDAISNGELELYYQPVVSVASETITGFEALLRWHHKTRGPISPTKFIPIAEDTGLIVQLGEWALRQACKDVATWPEDVRVAVNVSPLQFANPQLPAMVMKAIASAGISPEQLELELTESVFLSDNEGTDAMFASLKRIGVRIALDDFGTGYSSLGYLKKAPFDKIKIDQSFVRGATEQGSRNGAIIASITNLAHALGMDTTAEGVETMDELDLVRLHGCSHVQGFIYAKPMSAKDATERLASGLQADAHGPRSARAPRQKVLRKVVLDHEGQVYNGTVRNISSRGAMIEGLRNVPTGTTFVLRLSREHTISCTTRWCEEDRMGVQFERALVRDSAGRLVATQGAPPVPVGASATA
ncbi:EAL domain-containing protein [Aurantiacibacter xanthus]|uniref:EAL domain-containing protein n=1 Tax=Aurantiacibacter xanthus TaxID=1784712 RepID=UPI001FE4261A|nr:EAL domain-containing protein [Aurantiacibacter xanthus]